MHPICSLQRHYRLTNGVTITQALRWQFEKGWWVLWEKNCFLELPCPWLPVHLGSSRWDSMHFIRLILILFRADSCDNLIWFAFARRKVKAANSRNKLCGQIQVIFVRVSRYVLKSFQLYLTFLFVFQIHVDMFWSLDAHLLRVTTMGFPRHDER